MFIANIPLLPERASEQATRERADAGARVLDADIARGQREHVALLLDRQAKEWTYEMTTHQLARNCLSSPTTKDLEGFAELMRDVIDRARGRVKKEFDKTFRKIVWRKVSDQWVMEIQSFG